ncbi:hypothetical protein ISU10_07840 [Nocardioides agariphilus]|uniref:HTH luxR-type domain-containing protein n=1 Tax=Nocardioides agariphilus TaxID=433664 RepID=A0A930VMY0_9ACTN|nr:LuxR C-terminal-related transcriptional regulator [Nocardioides agariphilus]MBF4767675.1 hypothetical protein [Nocardioides agariphilus]
MPEVGSAIGGVGLVGREAELDTLHEALGSCALVTVTGLPGVGRSALAAAAASRLARAGTPVLTASLAGADEPLSAADAILAQLPGEGLSTSLPEAMWEAFDGAQVLLVLEDVDRVEGLSGVVQELLDGYPDAVVLCTAARPTGLAGERVFRLAPLPLPDDDAPPEHLTLALLARMAQDRGVVLQLVDPVQRKSAAMLCRHAGGLPGVMELAAARLAAVPLQAMARGLGAETGTDWALNPALDWTFDLLSKPARTALLQLSVFEGAFLLDAVGAVVDLGSPSTDPADVLLELVDAHLVELDPAGTGEPRFVIPQLVRGFSQSRIDPDARAAARDRHTRYFTDRARAGLEVVRLEWPDIVAALDHEMSTGRRLDDALAAAVALAPEVQEVPGAVASLEQRIDELLEKDAHVPDSLRARALLWSTSRYPGGSADDMQKLGLWTAQRLAEATTLARQSGDGPALLEALERTIMLLRITLDLAAAVSAAHEGLELARRLDDQPALARFECFVSMAAWSAGDPETAARLATSSVTRGREHDDAFAQVAGAHLLLTLPEELRPALDPPLPTLEELLAQCQHLDQPFTGMTVLASLAHESLAGGDARAAARWLWKLLMVGANRQRTEPMVTLAAVALLLSAALALGEEEDAARMREYTRQLELFVPYSITQPAVPRYERDVAYLDSSVPDELRQQLAAEMATMGMDRVNRWAQEVARRLAGHRPPGPLQPSRPTEASAGLTPREGEVLAALATGRTNREIADQLGMSAKTVMHHSVAIYRKLGVRGRAAATAWAYEHGLATEA